MIFSEELLMSLSVFNQQLELNNLLLYDKWIAPETAFEKRKSSMFNSYIDLLRKHGVKQNTLSVRTGRNTLKVQVSAGLRGVRCFTMSCASTLQLSLRAVQLQEWRSTAQSVVTWNHASIPYLFSWFPELSKLHSFFSWGTFASSAALAGALSGERVPSTYPLPFYLLEGDVAGCIWCCGSMHRGWGGGLIASSISVCVHE